MAGAAVRRKKKTKMSANAATVVSAHAKNVRNANTNVNAVNAIADSVSVVVNASAVSASVDTIATVTMSEFYLQN